MLSALHTVSINFQKPSYKKIYIQLKIVQYIVLAFWEIQNEKTSEFVSKSQLSCNDDYTNEVLHFALFDNKN